MSHFSVLLIGSENDIERFDENNEEVFTYKECTDTIIEDVKKYKKEGQTLEEFLDEWSRTKVFYDDETTAREIECKRLASSYALVHREDETIVKSCYLTNLDAKYHYYHVYDNDGYLVEKEGVVCDSLCVKDIDWDATIEKYREENRKLYREIIGKTGLFKEIPHIKTIAEYYNELSAKYPDKDKYELMRVYKDEYCNQEEVKKFNEYVEKNWNRWMFNFFMIEDYLVSEEEFVNLATLPFFAFVVDAEWYEKGTMGWWACVSNEKNKKEWVEIQNKIINELKTREDLQDEEVYLVDCHI